MRAGHDMLVSNEPAGRIRRRVSCVHTIDFCQKRPLALSLSPYISLVNSFLRRTLRVFQRAENKTGEPVRSPAAAAMR